MNRSRFNGAGFVSINGSASGQAPGELRAWNSTIEFDGDTVVRGSVWLENTPLTVRGLGYPPAAPLTFVPVNLTIEANGSLWLTNGSLWTARIVTVNGTLSLERSSFEIADSDWAKMRENRTLGELNAYGTVLAWNSSLTMLGPIRVGVRMTLSNSSLSIGQDPYNNQSVPYGITASPGAAVSFLDLDNSSATPEDASLVQGGGNGTYSRFGAGSSLTIRNSRVVNMGWEGYPAFELNGSSVDIAGASFEGPDVVAFSNFSGRQIAVAANLCVTVSVVDTSFARIPIPIAVRGGSGHQFRGLVFSGQEVGLVIENASRVAIANITAGAMQPYPAFLSWASAGVVLAMRNGTDYTVAGLRATGNATSAELQPLRALTADGIWNLSITGVAVDNAGAFIFVNGSRSLSITDVVGEHVGEGLRITNSANVVVSRATAHGDAPYALSASGCTNFTLTDLDGAAWLGVEFVGSSDVTTANLSLNVTQVGIRFAGGARFVASAFRVVGLGTGLVFANATGLALSGGSVEFSRVAIFGVVVDGLDIHFVDFTAVAAPDSFLRLVGVNGFALSSYTYAGPCGAAGSVTLSDVVSIDRLALPGCEYGLSITTSSYIDLPQLDLHGTWNGTALGLYTVTDAQVSNADLSSARYVGLALIGSSRVLVSKFTVSGAGLDGIFVQQGGAIDLSDGEALGVGGRGLAIVNATAPVTITRIRINGSGSGVEVITSLGVVLVDVESSRSAGDGVNFDAASTGASLRNLTLRENGGAGLRMDASGTRLVDGNISANVGEGISPGAAVRLDWRVENGASFVDGRTRFTGDLLVSAGASFLAQRAAFHLDPGPRQMPLAPPPLIHLGAGARALFDRVTFDSTNDSAPYTLEMSNAASVEILGSFFTGSGRGLSASAIQGAPDYLAIRNSTFVGFTRPLDVSGALVELSDVNYSHNDVGPHIVVQGLGFFNLTVENSTGAGLDVLAVPWVHGERLLARWNAGLGARFAGVNDLALDRSEVYGNLQGGLLLDNCVADLRTTSVWGNTAFGLRLQGGGRASLEDIQAYGNSGAGLAAEDLDDLSVDQALVYNGLGRGIDLTRVAVARFDRAQFNDNAAVGLRAVDVGNLTVVGARFGGNGVAHIVLQGRTVALFVDGAMERSPGDAVALNGTARGSFIALVVSPAVARVYAAEASYAYLLNSTFAPPFVADAARVDIAWNLSVVARRESGAPVVGATVWVVSAFDEVAASDVTGTAGSTATFTLMTRSVFGAGDFLAFSPHAFNASLPGGGGARLLVDVDRYMVVDLTVDGTPPVTNLTLEGVAGAGGWFVGPVTARLRAADAGGYGVTLFWRLSSGPWRNGTSPGNFTEDVVAVDAEGSTALQYYAVDGVDNREAVRTALVKIDLNAPTASFGNLPANVTGGEFRIFWYATDTAGSDCCTYSTERAYGDEPFEPWGNGSAAGGLFTPSAEGTYRFRLTAFDGAGRASRPVTGTLAAYLNGTLRIAVTDHSGAPLAAATIVVEGTNVSLVGAGPFDIRLAPGTYQLTVRAPGFVPRTIEATVVAHNLTDLGVLDLARVPETVTNDADQGPLGLVLLLVAVGAVLAFLSWRKSRQKAR